MSHFLGTPSRSHLWTLAESRNAKGVVEAKHMYKRLLSGPTVDIYVGPERRHWSIHKNLLCHHSSYFETELEGHEVPKEHESPSLDLLDDDPRGFELLVKWLYQGHLDDASHMTDEERYDYAVACHKLYQLCDKFSMTLLKNLAMDAYRSNLHSAQLVPDAEEINEIYHWSPEGSPFRKLMVKIAARQIMDPTVDKDAESYRTCFEDSADFAVELVNAIRQMSGGTLFDDPTEGQDCEEWHDHMDGSQCDIKEVVKVEVDEIRDALQVNHLPNSAARRTQQLPVAELSSERPTPRKLHANASVPSKIGNSSAKQSAKPPATPTRPRSVGQPSGQTSRKLNPVNGNSATIYPFRGLQQNNPNDSTKLNQPSKQTSPMRPKATPIKQYQRPNGSNQIARYPIKQPNKSINGVMSDKARSVGSGPRKLSHVSGMVKQFDGVNGALSDTRSESIGAMSERRAPPKLKRKVPG